MLKNNQNVSELEMCRVCGNRKIQNTLIIVK